MSIVLFPSDPDWESGFIEKVEYLTGISVARTGAEQRQKLRRTPRRTISFRLATLDVQESELFHAIAWNDQARVLGVPVWSDAVVYSGTLAAGTTTIAIDTTTRLFSQDGRVMVWSSALDCEVQTISSVSAGLLTITALSKTYTGPLMIAPVLPGRMATEIEVERTTGEIAQGDFTFLCEVV